MTIGRSSAARALRIVYCGPSECGKTTNLESVSRIVPAASRGKLVRLATETDRTLYFDHLIVDLEGLVTEERVRFELFTVPGQGFYVAARRRILRDAEGIVFVVDSRRERLAANVEALAEVVAAIQDAGRDVDDLPAVLQLNKRDDPSAVPVDELLVALGCQREAYVEAVAHTRVGVMETLREVCRLALQIDRQDGSRAIRA